MSAISPPVQTVLELFATELSDVRFGDVDATRLSTLAAEVASADEALTAAQALVDEARNKLRERQEALLQHAQRALAYARVYAEPDASLSARLEAIALPRPSRRARPETEGATLAPDQEAPSRPRGRPRKAPVATPMFEGIAANAE